MTSGGELFTDYSDHPRKLVTLGLLKIPNQQAPDATSFFPAGGMPTAKQRLFYIFSPKVGDAVALQQIKESVALYL